MKPMMIIGIILIVLGVAGLIFQGISYTSREKVVDIGSLHVTAEKEKTIPIPAILGGWRWPAASRSSWSRQERRHDQLGTNREP